MKLKTFFLKTLNGMAFGLFSTLIIGTIIRQIGEFTSLESIIYIGKISQLFMGAGIGVGIALSLESPPLIVISSLITGIFGAGSIQIIDGQSLIRIGEPVGAYVAAVVGILIAKKLAGKTKFDIILLPAVTIFFGCMTGILASPYIAILVQSIGSFINSCTTLNPVSMGIILSLVMGLALTSPLSSAAISVALGLNGLAAGASLIGCSSQMIGFATISYEENGVSGLLSQGLGTSMLQISNIIKNPLVLIPPIISSIILGPIATVIFKIESNSIGAGMGTSGLVGQITTISVMGTKALPAIIFLCFIAPIIINYIIGKYMRKKGYIKSGDLKI